jgi:Helix-turn-helix domain
VLGMLGRNDIIAGFIQFCKGLHLKLAGYSYREIGRRIGRSHIAISREIKHNGPKYPTKGAVCKNTMAPAGVFFQGVSLIDEWPPIVD